MSPHRKPYQADGGCELMSRNGRSDVNEKIQTTSTGRRAFLAGTGAAVTAGLAGCVGGVGGGSEGTVSIAGFPLDVDGIVYQYADEEGLIADHLEGTGWDYEVQLIFDEIPQYVSNQIHISGFSELEAARIGVEQEIETAVIARRGNAYFGWMVKVGSKWDPENTGGVQQTLNMIAEEGANIGVGGWGLGHIPADQIAFQQGYDLEMSEEGGDFSVVTAEIPAIPQLVDEGDLAIGASSPTHGAAGRLLDDTLKPLFWDHDKINELGLGLPPLAGVVTRQSFLDENEEVVRAVFEALNEGYDWFFESGLEEIPPDQGRREKLGVQNERQAEYAIEWQQHRDVKHRTEAIPRPKDITFTRDRINAARDFLGLVEEVGFIPSGWEDYVNMVTL